MAPRVAQLTPEMVRSEELLGAAVDTLLRAHPKLDSLSKCILATQEALRACLTEEQWGCYLVLEERVNERLAEALLVVATWAWRAGRRAR